MKHISIDISELNDNRVLSPEYWISKNIAASHSGSVSLGDLFFLSKKTTSCISSDGFVFDTANSHMGLINILKGESKERVSNKKMLSEGCVIISRLRPYLKQVTYIPQGFMNKLGVSSIWGSTEYYPLLPKDHGLNPAFLVPYLLSDDVQAILSKAATGGHHPRFNEDLLMSLKVSEEILDKADKASLKVINIINSNLDSQLSMARILSSHW